MKPSKPAKNNRNARFPQRPARGGSQPAPRQGKGAPRPPMKPQAPIDLPPPDVTLPQPLTDAWRRAVLSLAKLPRGMKRGDLTDLEVLQAVVRATVPAVRDIWSVYNEERSSLTPKLLMSAPAVIAYLVGFHLPNVARLLLALNRADARHQLRQTIFEAKSLVWHDLGAGTGALAHAGSSWLGADGLQKLAAKFHLYDGAGALLDAARAVFAESNLAESVKTHKLALAEFQPRRAELAAPGGVTVISLGYVWNELTKSRPAKGRIETLIEDAIRGRSPGDKPESLLLLLEPAQQEHAREAMVWRDARVAQGWMPLYPCPAAGACPMLERTRDWCFSEGSARFPRELSLLDKLVGTDRTRLNSSMYVLATPALAARLAKATPRPVIVGRPQRGEPNKPKGQEFDYLLCADGELNKSPGALGKAYRLRGQTLTP